MVSLIVIFVPMLLEDPVTSDLPDITIPEKPPTVRRAIESRDILPSPISAVPEQEEEPGLSAASQPPAQEEPPGLDEASEPPAQEPPPQRVQTGRTTPSAWMVQVASFSQQENADKLVQRLRKAGLAASQVEVDVGGKHRYRVQLPPQVDRKEAEALQQRIKKEFKLSARLVQYSG